MASPQAVRRLSPHGQSQTARGLMGCSPRQGGVERTFARTFVRTYVGRATPIRSGVTLRSLTRTYAVSGARRDRKCSTTAIV